MDTQDAVGVIIEVSIDDATDDDIDEATRNLLGELREADVESADLVSSGPSPEGTKSTDAVTIGAIAVAVLPTFLPKIVEFVQAWALRGQGRTVKFKGMISGQSIEFEGRSEDLQKLLAMISGGKKEK